MKILIFGDIYGRLGRKAFIKEFPKIKQKFGADVCIANIENITSGRGPASVHAEMIDALGVDLMTGGDHVFDNMPDIGNYFKKIDCKLIRPANFVSSTKYEFPGVGHKIIQSSNGKKLLVIQLLGEAFMNHKVENPFLKVDEILSEFSPDMYDSCVVEFHRETTAEIQGMAHYLDGRVACVYGTHTHVQTNDARILGLGTGTISDVGMNGPYEGVIGADFKSVEKRFLTGISRGKIEQKLSGKYVISGLYIETNDESGSCTHIENISFTSAL